MLFSIHVNTEFKVVATKKCINIPLRDVVTSFSGTLKTYSELDEVISKVEMYNISFQDTLKSCSQAFQTSINSIEEVPEDRKRQLEFLFGQLNLQCNDPNGRRYSVSTIRDALSVFFEEPFCVRRGSKTVDMAKC